ncbi:unnamed protein product, partial [Rotaria sp. Silwood1]
NRGFFIQKLSNNSLTLLTDHSYDREKYSSYDVFIYSGNNQRTFRIIVTDINDCKPIWNTTLLYINIKTNIMTIVLNASDYDENDNGKIGYRKKNFFLWPKWINLIDNKLIINCTNETDNYCWYDLLKNDIFIDIEAYDYEKSIQISSSEQSSSADSLYGSEKSDNITLETAASCHLDMFLFSPKRGIILTDSPYQYSFMNKTIHPSDNLTNKLFHSIQNDLSLLTDTKQDIIINRGTYV